MLTRRAFFGLLAAAPVVADDGALKIDRRLLACTPQDLPISCEWKCLISSVCDGDEALREVHHSLAYLARDKDRAKKWMRLLKAFGNQLGHAQAACKLDKF